MRNRSQEIACRSLGVVVLVATLGGCVTMSPEEDPVLIKLRELESRIAQVERIIENQSLVGLLTELQQAQRELGELRDEVETLAFETEAAGDRQRNLYVDLDGRLNALEQDVTTPSTAGTPDDGQPGGEAGATPVVDDRDAYKTAFGLLEEGRYDEAGAAFAGFVETYPDSGLVDNAQYWLAEALYVERQFEQALREFNEVIESYPDSRKIPDALLKVGYSHYELQQYDQARAALERVIADYPESTAARLAGQRLDRMSAERR